MQTPLLRSPGFIAGATIAGTTLGAGIFAFPYLLVRSGILPTVTFLVVLTAVIVYAHVLYWRTLREQPATTHLLSLVRDTFGPVAAKATFLVTTFGILFTLAAYLILGATFISSLTGFTDHLAMILFWALCSIPLVFNLRRLLWVEIAVTAVMGALIVLLIGTVPISLERFDLVQWQYVLLPFGPILFALAGWTAIEPAIAAVGAKRGYRLRAIGLGTAVVSVAYLLFALALGSAGNPVTPDTISGVLHLPVWQISALLVFGLAAIVTSYLPMNLEIRTALRDGLHWPRSWAFTVALFLPYLLILAGFNSFLGAVELVGGVFLAAQYVAIIQVSRHVLKLSGWQRYAANGVSILFALAALVHLLSFIAPGIGLR